MAEMLIAAVTLVFVVAAHNKRLGRWCRLRGSRELRHDLDTNAADRWRLLLATPPGPSKDRMIGLHATIAELRTDFERKVIGD